MKETPKNIVASIQTRLKNVSIKQGKPFAEILQYYAMERFLYRFSKTKYAGKFILKCGLLFYVWSLTLRRPTKDMDFRGYVENSPHREHAASYERYSCRTCESTAKRSLTRRTRRTQRISNEGFSFVPLRDLCV